MNLDLLSIAELAPFKVTSNSYCGSLIASDPLTGTAKVEFPALFYCF